MDVSTNYNLIPYPDHNYQVLPYVQDNEIAHQDAGQGSNEPHKLIRRTPSANKAEPIHFDFHGNNYDVTRCLQYSDADQVGHLVDVYA
jgi:hypothetical protein